MCGLVENLPVLSGGSNKLQGEKWDHKKALLKALKERDLLLKEKPGLVLFQKEIDSRLQRVSSFEEKMKVLGTMIGSRLNILYEECFKLNTLYKTYSIKSLVEFEVLEKGSPDSFFSDRLLKNKKKI